MAIALKHNHNSVKSFASIAARKSTQKPDPKARLTKTQVTTAPASK